MNREKKPAQLEVCLGGHSTSGQREINQDAFAVKNPYSMSEKNFKGIVACVADGVSCSSNGQQASHTSVTQFINDYYCTNQSWSVKQSASKVLNSLNTWLYQHNKEDVCHNGLITTFSCIVFKSTTAHLLHVGDSRIYRYRSGQLTQLTHDHSRAVYKNKSVLTRALGMDCHLDIDYQSIPLQQGDLFMLCSDGVHDFLSKPILTNHLKKITNQTTTTLLEMVAEDICQDAVEQGSSDNSSCLILQVAQLPNANINELFEHLSGLTIPPALQVGNEIDAFKINRILHQGTRSHVYLATDKNTRQQVVLKMPSLNFEEDLSYLQGFYKEQWVGQSLNHPSIMSISKNTHSLFLYHICDYVKGITLRQWMQENPQLELQQVQDIINKVVNAVRVLQRAGMVHRDLKPENIMLSANHVASSHVSNKPVSTDNVYRYNKITLIDFGTVKINSFEEIVKSDEEIPLGAVDYIAPEYLHNGEASQLSDLFSIAVITYEMLSGHLPYPNNHLQSLHRAKNANWLYQPIKALRSDLPTSIDKVLIKALQTNPSRRYSSMSEFITELSKSTKGRKIQAPKPSLLESNPIKFWQSLTLLFFSLSLLELLLLIGDFK